MRVAMPESEEHAVNDHKVTTDLIAGLVLSGLSAVMAFWSTLLPRPSGWASAPGLTPLIAFGLVGILGACLAGRAVSAGAIRNLMQWRKKSPGSGVDGSAGKLAFLILALFAYFLILPRFLPFEVSTFLFLLTMFAALHTRSIMTNACIAAAITLGLSGLFSQIFGAVLPGVEWQSFAPTVHAFADGAMTWLLTGW